MLLRKSGILYKKESHPPTGSKEEVDLIKLLTEKQGEPFKEITTSLKDPDSLQNNFTLSQRLRHTEEAWRNVDMLAPCNILFPTEEEGGLTYRPNGKIKRMYLFIHFRQLTINDVAASCKYYAKYVTFPLRDGVSEGNFTN